MSRRKTRRKFTQNPSGVFARNEPVEESVHDDHDRADYFGKFREIWGIFSRKCCNYKKRNLHGYRRIATPRSRSLLLHIPNFIFQKLWHRTSVEKCPEWTIPMYVFLRPQDLVRSLDTIWLRGLIFSQNVAKADPTIYWNKIMKATAQSRHFLAQQVQMSTPFWRGTLKFCIHTHSCSICPSRGLDPGGGLVSFVSPIPWYKCVFGLRSRVGNQLKTALTWLLTISGVFGLINHDYLIIITWSWSNQASKSWLINHEYLIIYQELEGVIVPG